MNNRGKLVWAIALMSGLAVPSRAEAYCVRSEPVIAFWSVKFPDLRIPVWISVSQLYTVANTGQTPEDVARLAIAVIARHNESVLAPKLYFAGFTPFAYDVENMTSPLADLPAGITIMSMPCEKNEFLCGEGATGCANFASRPGNLDPLGWVFFVPPGCDDSAGYSMNSYGDMAQIMLHELGHTLGLRHSNQTQAQCEAKGYVFGGPPTGTSGVMHSVIPAGFASDRSWRRDDLHGFDHLYGAAAQPHELVWWDDVDYPSYPPDEAATSLAGMPVSRTAVVANRNPADTQALVTTAPDGRVIHRLLDAQGLATPDLADVAVDPSPSGISYALPAVALSDPGPGERVFVAWMANESRESDALTLRTAVRSTSELAWQYADHPDIFRVNRLAAGYDSASELFVVATLTPNETELALVLFDVDGTPLGPAIVLEGLHAFGVGAPLCEAARCLIPVSESEFGGPDFGVAEVAIDRRTLTASLLSTEILGDADSFGGPSLVRDAQGLFASMGERRFFLGDYPGLSPDGVETQANPGNRD